VQKVFLRPKVEPSVTVFCQVESLHYFCARSIWLGCMKILVIRFSSIGDIVLTTPVLRCLKKQLEAEIHVLTRKSNQVLFTSNPYVDQLHTYDKKLSEVIPSLRAANFDFIVDLHKNLRSFLVRIRLNKPSASFPKLNIQKYLLVNFKINKMPSIHIVDRYFEAVKKLKVQNDGEGLDFFIPENQGLKPADLPEFIRDEFIAIVIGGKHATKILPAEKVIAVCRYLTKPVILLGGSEDADRGKLIADALDEKVWNSCGLLSLNQSASIIKMAQAVLTNDTGLMHIAAAFRKNIISVWGNTVPELGMYPYLPGKDSQSVIIENKSLSCRPCSKIGFEKCPIGHFKCMRDLNESSIAEAIKKLSR